MKTLPLLGALSFYVQYTIPFCRFLPIFCPLLGCMMCRQWRSLGLRPVFSIHLANSKMHILATFQQGRSSCFHAKSAGRELHLIDGWVDWGIKTEYKGCLARCQAITTVKLAILLWTLYVCMYGTFMFAQKTLQPKLSQRRYANVSCSRLILVTHRTESWTVIGSEFHRAGQLRIGGTSLSIFPAPLKSRPYGAIEARLLYRARPRPGRRPDRLRP